MQHLASLQAFSFLMDRLSLDYSRTAKITLLAQYFLKTPDPARGFALGAMLGALDFKAAKPALLKSLISARVDPVYFSLSYDYVGDLSETIALLWPAKNPLEPPHDEDTQPLDLAEITQILTRASRADLMTLLPQWLDGLDVTGRWALLKLMTGGLRIGVSAKMAQLALHEFAKRYHERFSTPNTMPDLADLESLLHALTPPYEDLFAYLEARAPRPTSTRALTFYAPMLATSFEAREQEALSSQDFIAEWKWDGVRIQVQRKDNSAATDVPAIALFSRTGENMLQAFPDVAALLCDPAFGTCCLDGELLVKREAIIAPFQDLQQRLNRKSVSPKLVKQYPAHIRFYDALVIDGVDMRACPFTERRAALEALINSVTKRQPAERKDNFDDYDLLGAKSPSSFAASCDVSSLVPFDDFTTLDALRNNPALIVAPEQASAIEGVMLKRHDSPYLAGRPKGHWFKWKRTPYSVDAVLMYAQRGHGKRSSFYSDFTFGVWQQDAPHASPQLVPVGKAYFGFSDDELKQLDHYVRAHTKSKFGPVREVVATQDEGLVLEIAFEGLALSPRHKSGVAMRFPRIARIRWDKPAREADGLDTLKQLLAAKNYAKNNAY